ncbi:MAG: transglutaminaseTgpA domain-containing protein, partial [Anaerolineales bacterium]|nr:transglutaminaseTgpA domain-containing protein [Anaerolineales bacterium]
WLVAVLRFPLVKAAPALILVGAAVSFLLGGRLVDQIGAVLAELNRLAFALTAAANPQQRDYSSVLIRAADLATAVGIVSERLWIWLGAWQGGDVPIDPIATTVIWAWGVWVISAWAGWSLRERRDPLLAALPAVVVSAVALSATGTRSGGLYVMLGALLLLVAAVQHEERERQWQRNRVAFPSSIGWDIGKRAMLVASGIVLLTALVPSVSFSQVRDWLTPDPVPRANSSPSIAETLGLRREPVPQDPLEDVRRPGLPREHLIGSGPELSDQHVLRVKAENLDGRAAGSGLPALYWRALTYDVYTGRGWRSSGTTEERYQAEYPIRPRNTSHTITLGQQVELIDRESTVLLAAGELISVDRAFTVARRDPRDVFAVTAQVDEVYRVVSAVPSPGEAELRSAGTEYPESIRRRFLQLPDDLPERVRSLALQHTAAERTAYDRARALEGYLREYPYNLEVDRPPLHRDVVDFFLFDERQG